jgi:hypothetical protein
MSARGHSKVDPVSSMNMVGTSAPQAINGADGDPNAIATSKWFPIGRPRYPTVGMGTTEAEAQAQVQARDSGCSGHDTMLVVDGASSAHHLSPSCVPVACYRAHLGTSKYNHALSLLVPQAANLFATGAGSRQAAGCHADAASG